MTATAERVITYLLVEDNDDHADIVQRCFHYTKLPVRVHRVATGMDCLKYLDAEEPFADRGQCPYPDMVLLDIRMPGLMDGLRTLHAIRSDPKHRCLPVTMLTGSVRGPDVDRVHELGVNGYIVKSGNTGEMMQSLRNLQHSLLAREEQADAPEQAAGAPPQ